MPSQPLVNVKVTLDRWFEDQCTTRKMSKQDVADAMGVSVNSLGRALNRPEKADAQIIRGLAEVFQIGDWPDVLVKEFGFGTDELTNKEWDQLLNRIGYHVDFTINVAA